MRINSLFRNKKGQSTVEYVLILAAVVAAIFMFKDRFTQGISGSVDGVFQKIDDGVDDLSDQ